MKKEVPIEQIESFLEGKDQQKYIVAVEGSYGSQYVNLIINNPEKGKIIEKVKYKPFLWAKPEGMLSLFKGNKETIRKAMSDAGIKAKKLKISNDEGFIPERMANGFTLLIEGNCTYGELINFFKRGGVDIFSEQHKKNFITLSIVEQFMIQTGKRLFKGMEDYDDLHRLQFDLETTGLNPKINRIFAIGIRDNRGHEIVLEVDGETEEEIKNKELLAIETFFAIVDELKPDIISGYNSENFDFDFFIERCHQLGVNIENIAITLNPEYKIQRKKSTVKYGSETEYYEQTLMYGYNIIDIYHAVRRAQAINSNIKKADLKYITKYSKINKPNRVYIKGDNIFHTWSDKENKYAFNDINGDWYKITDKHPLKEGYQIVEGKYIVKRYLLDDLWETQHVDFSFNQASFLLSKIVPTSYSKICTMGTASLWKLLMCAWSYEQGLGIPDYEEKRDFTGGLSRLLVIGYTKGFVKFDYAALYPNIELTWDIFPELDISGVMKGMLLYIAITRDKYKDLKNVHENRVKEIEKNMLEYEAKDELTPELRNKCLKAISKHDKLAKDADKKQLPIKILANSFFGSFGASYIFPWGDINCAEETTCRGRQYLRLLISHFKEKHGFRPLVGDSVTYDTPIYVKWKNNGMIDIIPICDIFNENSNNFDKYKLRDLEEKPYQVLTVNGWKEINYVYKHESNKPIHRISTKNRMVCVTEDHSLFQNGKQIKPSSLKRNDLIDVSEIEHLNKEGIYDEDLYFLFGYFLGDGSSVYGNRKQYYKSKKTGKININKGKRYDFKISGQNLEKLERLKKIIESRFNISVKIKDHLKSSKVYNLVSNDKMIVKFFADNFYTSYREKRIPYFILNSSKKAKLAFLNGVFSSDGYGDDLESASDIGMKSQVAMAGISYLMDCLNIDKKLKLRKDKNFISLKLKNRNRNNSNFTNKTKMKSNEVWNNEIIHNKNKFVYDISTEDGTFIGGIGGVNLKNTDGFNFAIPENIDSVEYVSTGNHRFTEKGKLYKGIKAVVAEFNDKYMIGRMGLDIDEIGEATINFSRKNYADLIDGEIKLVGNTVKSKKMELYIEEFIDNGIRMLLEGRGYDFIEYYYEYIDKIFNFQIPIMKIASKGRIKQSIDEYKMKCKKLNKAGNPMPRQAHMELIIKDNINVNLGDTIYYVNTGNKKSHADIKTIKNKETGEIEVEFNCILIPNEQIENDPDLTTDKYNVAKYIDKFNKRIKPLLVVFHPDIRENILIDTKIDKSTKKVILEERSIFTRKETELVSGMPYNPEDQDDYEYDLMKMEDKEIRFWISINKVPNNIDLDKWKSIKADYLERLEKAKINGLEYEMFELENKLKRLEVEDFDAFSALFDNDMNAAYLWIIENLKVDLDFDETSKEYILKSLKWDEKICNLNDIFKYKSIAEERALFYSSLGSDITIEEAYKEWEEYQYQKMAEKSGMSLEDYKRYIIEWEKKYRKEKTKAIVHADRYDDSESDNDDIDGDDE